MDLMSDATKEQYANGNWSEPQPALSPMRIAWGVVIGMWIFSISAGVAYWALHSLLVATGDIR